MYYLIEGINAVPWQAPKLGIGRKAGRQYPMSYPVDEMIVYKEAIKEYLYLKYPQNGPLIARENLLVSFWYWRSLNFGGQRRNRCDVTNLNKCLEDALQGVLFNNDRDNRIVLGVMMRQDRDIEPHIVIQVEPIDVVPPVLRPPATLLPLDG
jgi:Holliday junction resolvase RusA-like endonuclease